ncbi:MAG: helix-turn-helix domain-containing protein [Sphingomonadaceae bacterium]
MSVAITHTGLPEGVSRRDLVALVDQVGKSAFGLSSTAKKLLCKLISKTSDEDYEPGRICSVWCKSIRLANELELSPRSINLAEGQLAKAGVVVRETGKRGYRNGDRVGGIIVWACGINLAPFIERYQELKAAAEAERLQELADEACRADIRIIGRQIRESGEVNARDRANEILPDGRTANIRNSARLEEIRDALAGILQAIKREPRRQKTTHGSEETGAHNTEPESIQESCSDQRAPEREASGVTVRQALSVATPEFCEIYAAQVRSGWPGLADAARQLASSQLAIGQKTWGAMCHRRGPEVAALSIILIDRHDRLHRDHPWRVKKSPGGCFVGLMRNPRNLMRMFRASQGLAEEHFCTLPQPVETTGQEDTGQIGNLIARLMPSFGTREVRHERN